ncbi:hypothetical protein FQN57_005412 [Myotisia sp. PD_48]|nr:hypothetical protein FQN57_005412 [Myotisia sp. PD_48]
MTQEPDNKADYATTSARWRAIVNRDAAATCFVYGVRTTKIYCRPRCPARLARRANVEFYDTPPQAEKAGYRPCKRCKPEDLRAPTDPHIRLAQRACETMTLAALAGGEKQRPTLSDLSSEAGLTPSHFHRVFKKVVGLTPGKFARELMEKKSLGKPVIPTGINAAVGWPLPHIAALVGMNLGAPQQPDLGNGVGGVPGVPGVPSVADLGNQQKFKLLGEPPIPRMADPLLGQHDFIAPNNVGTIDWNEFDMMLAATTSAMDPRQQQLAYAPQTATAGLYMPTDTSGFDPNSLLGDPLLPVSNQTDTIAFAQYMNEPIDLSFLDQAYSSPDTLGLDTPNSTSVPSLHSHHSTSPTDSPLLFDSYTGLSGSPLLDNMDWLDNQHVYQHS